MLPGRRDGVGRLFVKSTPPPAFNAPFMGGIALSGLGQVQIATAPANAYDAVTIGAAPDGATTPDSVANSITGDIDIRILAVPAVSWSAANQALLAKDAGATNYAFVVFTFLSGLLGLRFTQNGTTLVTLQSTVAVPISAVGVRITRVAATGLCNFYYTIDRFNWVLLGAPNVASTPGAIFDSTMPLRIGGNNSGNFFNGKIYEAEIRNGINGPVAVSFDASNYRGGTTLPGDTGEVWTLQGAAVISSTGNPFAFTNGFMVDSIGQLIVAPGGGVATFQEGLPRDATGKLVTLANGTPVALPDGSYNMLGGLCIANTGLYTTDATPA